MKILTLSFLLFICFHAYAKNEFSPFRAYLDVEERQKVSVFNYPDEIINNPDHLMENWKFCDKDLPSENSKKIKCKNANGWLPRDAKITVIKDKISKKTKDPLSEDVVTDEYYKISFEYWVDDIDKNGKFYRRKVQNEGYIEAAVLSKKDRTPFYATIEPPRSSSKKICPQKGKCIDASIIEKSDPLMAAVQEHAAKDRINNLSIISTADAVQNIVGDCNLKRAEEIKALGPIPNSYDKFILPRLKEKLKLINNKEIKNEKGEPVTHEQIIDVDALARTMYAEMGRCYKKGLQYPMAVARITKNRSTASCVLKNAIFIQGPHDKSKTDIARVATSPRQFNLWLKSEGTRKNGPLLQALCPPKNSEQKFYTGSAPLGPELAIWKNSVRIATEAVLYPDRFKNRTEQLEARYYYTSGMGKFYNLEQVVPAIEGRRLDDSGCMEIWRDLARDHICNGGVTPKFDKIKSPAAK